MEFEFVLNKKGFKLEKDFTARLGKQFRDAGGFFYKIPDEGVSLKPYDAILCWQGETFHLEIKVGAEKSKVDVYKKLRPQQIYSLRTIAKNGGKAYVVYYNMVYNTMTWVKFMPDTQSVIINLKT